MRPKFPAVHLGCLVAEALIHSRRITLFALPLSPIEKFETPTEATTFLL